MLEMTARECENAIDSLKDKIARLQERIKELSLELCGCRAEYRHEIECLHNEIAALREATADELEDAGSITDHIAERLLEEGRERERVLERQLRNAREK